MNKEAQIILELSSGDILGLTVLSDTVIRLRMGKEKVFARTATERYGIVNECWEPVKYDAVDDGKRLVVKTSAVSLVVDVENECIMLSDSTGKVLVESMKPFPTKMGIGTGAACRLKQEEKFYGLGFRATDFIQLRGHSLRNHVSYGECYGPIPFVMSSSGWGLYFNTTFDSFFDFGRNDPDIMNIWSEKGDLDFYLMAGDYPGLLNSFTQIAGRPMLMPLWGYGLMFIANEKENQFDILNDGKNFRDERLPCDMIGLEPGWMAKHYDQSIEKDWDREKFYMPWWSEDRKQFQDINFIGALKRYGYKTSLWLCCDYDVYAEEERQAKLREETTEDKSGKLEKPFGFGKLDFDPRAHSPIYMDQVTKKDRPWFDHLKKFIDSGVMAFKQDPAFVVNDHPDRLYANGMTDEEGHNLITTVLAKQVSLGYREYTGQRPMHFVGTGYTGIQKWAPAWTCDCGGRETAAMGLILYGMCGHMNLTCDMDVHSAEGIHFGFLQPWSLINSWASIEHPWWLGEEMYSIFKEYAYLHYSLIPYTYSYAHIGHRTGMPILRAMPLMYPDDAKAENLTRQYMLGDYLLVGVFTDTVYLPEGKWTDYWTGEVYDGKQHVRYTPPKDKGGALFVKTGAIIPMCPDVLNATRKQHELLELHIFPGEDSSFTLYEDDGVSFDYEAGAVAMTEIRQKTEAGRLIVDIGERVGTYEGMPEKRQYKVIVHGDSLTSVIVNGEEIEWDKDVGQGDRYIVPVLVM